MKLKNIKGGDIFYFVDNKKIRYIASQERINPFIIDLSTGNLIHVDNRSIMMDEEVVLSEVREWINKEDNKNIFSRILALFRSF